ncbi:MAG: hypothetical protein EOO04_31540 [Chitinophagaceae bacterium]|nr:MAG: hypothetical protein EOO04_31540 [Chitinophagaceae bacterium]
MKVFLRHIIAVFLLLVINVAVYSQVSVKASVDRDKILIGEPITLTLQAYTPLGETITWFALDTIQRFEFISKGKLDTIESVDNKRLEQTLVITTFDSGSVVLPPLEMQVGDRVYLTDSVLIDVAYKNFDPAAEYKDIKAIEEVEDNSTEYMPWIIGAVTLIAIALIVWLMRKKKKLMPGVAVAVNALPPYEEAMSALANLKKIDWSLPNASKDYYSELNDIFRVYVNRAMGITSLEKTNDELILQLRQSGLSKDGFAQLAQTLRMSDFVKFARYKPEMSDNDQNWEVIKTSIKTLNNLKEPEKDSAGTTKQKPVV